MYYEFALGGRGIKGADFTMDTRAEVGRSNSASLRDREFVIHPMTNLAQHAEEGPLIIERGKGVYIEDDQGPALYRGCIRAVVDLARLRPGASGEGRLRSRA